MSKIKEKIDQIRSKFTDDNKMPEGIDSLLSSIVADETSYQTEISDAVEVSKSNASESKGRKFKIREHEKTIESLNSKTAELQTKIDEGDHTEELTELRTFKKSTVERRTKSFTDRIKIISKHEKFDLVKEDFVLPENYDPEKEDVDFSKIEEVDMAKNIAAMDRLDKIQYFGENGTNNKQDQMHNHKFNQQSQNKKEIDTTTVEGIQTQLNKAAEAYK